MGSSVAVAEIFYSLQGEGYHTGTPAIFLRTAGCNLACDFCDTDFSLRQRMEPEAIKDELKQYPCQFIVLTGGEPTLQAEALRPLIRELREDGYYVTLETNGTSPDTLGVDWVTVSPKENHGGEWVLREGDELKLIYEGQDLSRFEESAFRHYYLQPKEIRSAPWGKGERLEEPTRRERQRTTEALLQHPRWRLSLQIHKELGIP